jgi:hypothetical protein
MVAIGAALVGIGTIISIVTLPTKWKQFRFLAVLPIGYGSVIGLGHAYEGKAFGLSVYWLVILGLVVLIVFLVVAARLFPEQFDEFRIAEKRREENQQKQQAEAPKSKSVGNKSGEHSHGANMPPPEPRWRAFVLGTVAASFAFAAGAVLGGLAKRK